MRSAIFILLNTLPILFCYGQSTKFSSILEIALKSDSLTKTNLVFQDQTIVIDRYSAWLKFNLPEASIDSNGRHVIDKDITFRRCNFIGEKNQNHQITNLAFTGEVSFYQSKGITGISNCEFGSLNVSSSDFEDKFFTLKNCDLGNTTIRLLNQKTIDPKDRIGLGLPFYDNGDFYYIDNRSQGEFSIIISDFWSFHFTGNELLASNETSLADGFYTIGSKGEHITSDRSILVDFKGLNEVFIISNTILGPKGEEETPEYSTPFLISESTTGNLNIEKNFVDIPFQIYSSKIEDRLIIRQNEFANLFGVTLSLLPELFIDNDWKQISGNKLYVRRLEPVNDSTTNQLIYSPVQYDGDKVEDMGNEEAFRELVDLHAKWYRHYKEKAHIESSNGVYAELQSLYTLRYRYLYQNEGGIKNWFRWKLNSLLEFYINYGTDPARALVISFYIIVFFGIFYFFFPSEWDIASKDSLITELRSSLKKKSDKRFKSFVRSIGLLFLSFINAFTLSLNAFVTLGFGTIPTRGVARYVCIIQGFMGWFLLSLFSVALINQVIF